MQVSEEAVAQGRRVMEQAAEQLREILREGNLLMLPVLPSAPPDRSAALEELAAFERAALQLSSIAALAGLPQARLQCGLAKPPLRTIYSGTQTCLTCENDRTKWLIQHQQLCTSRVIVPLMARWGR